MHKIRLFLRQFFDMSIQEINGFIVLFILLLIFTFAPFIFNKIIPSDTISINDKIVLDSIISTIQIDKISTEEIKRVNNNEIQKFDPNTADKQTMINAGLPVFISERILKFRNKAGKFNFKTDIKKIYGLTDKHYKLIENYLLLPDKLPEVSIDIVKAEPKKIIKSATNPIMDINIADSNQLESINGIGFKLANRIIKYRTLLGGFVSFHQLYEVYGLDSSVIENIKNKSTLLTNFTPTQLNINNSTLDELRKHPYIGFKKAKTILAYRSQHGNFNNLEELNKIKTIDKEFLDKISPYLIFE